jgi:hypothetical protein
MGLWFAETQRLHNYKGQYILPFLLIPGTDIINHTVTSQFLSGVE